ncbi:MAG: peptidylprolyl isomerase [Anaerolineae bacterium]
MHITDGKVVHIHYTLTDDAGEILDTSAGGEPLAYLHGAGNIIPGLENALEGKQVGDTLTVVVPPEQGYGVYNDELVDTALLSQFPNPEQVEVGVSFRVQMGDMMYIATVTDIAGDTVTFDMNHPLAGVTLNFDVAVVAVEDATPEELAHGHVHAHGAHGH